MVEKSELFIDYGKKADRVKASAGRCVQDFINKRGIPSFQENIDIKNNPIVVLRSNTVDIDHLCEMGVRTYPSIDLLSFISNKMRFKRAINNIGILGPSTNLLPSRYLQQHHDYVDKISDEWLVKPNVTIGEHRGVAPQVLFYPFSEKEKLFAAAKEFEIDFVKQRFIRGRLKKVFAIKWTDESPNGFSFEHGYKTEDHFSIEKATDKSQIETEVCHPIILAKMQYLLAKFGLLWSGIDYVESDNGGYVYVIDMNPTNHLRKIY